MQSIPQPDLLATRERLGLTSWGALARLLGVPLRRLDRWRKRGVPESDQVLLARALRDVEREAEEARRAA